MGNCNYTWYQFKMYVGCLKCGAKIAMQSVDGKPHCQECGEVNENTWEEVCSVADIKDLRKGQVSNKKITSPTVDISLKTANADGISCHHCKTTIDLHEDLKRKSCNCPSCDQKLEFENLSSYGDFVFYRYVNQKIDPSQQNSVIAVHCAACGAPLQKDPGKINYNCNFCGCENILPVALRQKRVLDDIFAGIQERTIAPDKILEITNYRDIIACLKANKKEVFGAGVLNNLQLKFPDNLQIYHFIANEMKHEFSNETFEKLWEATNSSAFLNILVQKLNKSENEKSARIKKAEKIEKKSGTQNSEQSKQNDKESVQNFKKDENGFFDSLKKLFE